MSLNNRRELLLIVGTTEITGEARIFGSNPIEPGMPGIIFFIPTEPMFAYVGDHFVVRLPTPMVTIGGGRILDHLPRVPRRKDFEHYVYLRTRARWQVDDIVVSELQKLGVVRRESLLTEAALSREKIDEAIDRILPGGEINALGEYVYHVEQFKAMANRLYKGLSERLKESTHVSGLSIEEVHGLSSFPRWKTELLMRYLADTEKIEIVNDTVKLAGRNVSLSGDVKKAYEDIMRQLKAAPYTPPTLTVLAKQGKAYRDAIGYILNTGEGYKCGADFIFLKTVWDEITGFIKSQLLTTKALGVANLREKFGVSRKYVIPILEETDRMGLTRRDGDVRVKGENFGK